MYNQSLRFAGQVLKSPRSHLAIGGAMAIGGAYGLGRASSNSDEFTQLKRMGLSDEDALTMLEELRYQEEQSLYNKEYV